MEPIKGFRGQYRWLSNFWPAKVTVDVIDYPSVEHAYQAAKTLDLDQRQTIARLATAGQAKKFGSKVQLREDWEQIKLEVMENLLRQKFADPELRKMLLDTEDAYLEECNTWGDRWWGVSGGKGENHLGKLLMKLRDELRAGP